MLDHVIRGHIQQWSLCLHYNEIPWESFQQVNINAFALWQMTRDFLNTEYWEGLNKIPERIESKYKILTFYSSNSSPNWTNKYFPHISLLCRSHMWSQSLNISGHSKWIITNQLTILKIFHGQLFRFSWNSPRLSNIGEQTGMQYKENPLNELWNMWQQQFIYKTHINRVDETRYIEG